MRILKRLLLILIILLVIIVLARNVILKNGILYGSKSATGLQMNVDSVDMGLMTSAAGLNGLTIANPEGFPEGTILSIPEIYVDYNHKRLLGDTVHVQEIRLDIDTIDVVKNSAGDVNIMEAMKSLQERFKSPATGDDDETPDDGKPGKALQIDRMKLRIGTVRVTDHTVSPPTVKEFPVNIDEEFENITSPVAIGTMIATRTMMASGMDLLSSVDLQQLKNMGSLYPEETRKIAEDTIAKVKKASDQLLDSTAGTNTIKKATDVLKGILQ